MFQLKTYLPLFLLLSVLAGSIFSCRPESEIITPNPEYELRFSTDTVIFDTVFSTIGSITKRLKVYNPNERAVEIDEVSLGRGESSSYRLWVQGEEQEKVTDQILYGGDSLLLLVEVTIDPEDENLPFLVKDSVVFKTARTLHDVKLVSWGQDAHFFRSNGRFSVLDCQSRWTADRPYVIYDSLYVEADCELVIEEGCQIYFNKGAGLYVSGQLQIEGTVAEPVILQSVRLDGNYEKASGQWQGVVFLEGSRNNTIFNTSIRNADVGLWLNTFDEDDIPDLTLKNVRLENMSSAGILAVNSDLYAANLLANHCETFSALHLGGGNYTYEHCTLVGDGSAFGNDESLVFSDQLNNPGNDSLIVNPMSIRLVNSIVWGNLEEELLISNSGGMPVEIDIHHNILRTKSEFLDKDKNLLTTAAAFPRFVAPADYDYRLDSLSPAVDYGTKLLIEKDLEGFIRDEKPDVGAYEWKSAREDTE